MRRETKVVLTLFILGLLYFGAKASGGDRASVKATPRIVNWNGHEEVVVKLLVRVSDPDISELCVFWMDGEKSCREVTETPYSNLFFHSYKTCVFDGDSRNGAINQIVVAFGDGEKKVLQLSAPILFAGCS